VTEEMVELAKAFTEQQRKEHRDTHFGAYAARFPIFLINWLDVIPCCLHMKLRMYVKSKRNPFGLKFVFSSCSQSLFAFHS
jgi:hypothetical protein